MEHMNEVPRDEGLDHSLTVLKEGYEYILNRRKQFQSDIFETRVLGKKAICMGGREAAKLFYDNEKFIRQGAAPNRVVQTLFGKNGVQTLDGKEHQHRKALFMSMMSKESVENIIELTKLEWEISLDKWSQMGQIVFYDEMKELLCKVAFKWIGYPIHEKDVGKVTKEIASMFETPAAIGPTHWLGRNARNNMEKNIQGVIQKIRNKEVQVASNTILYQFAFHKDLNGNLLDIETAAVEVINMLRPIVANAIFINFLILALHEYPKERDKLKTFGDYKRMFVHEVRRFYPFFPFVVAKVKKDFNWNGYSFKEGTLTLLDLYGTNHDSNLWENPNDFNPERFANWKEDRFSLIPQGGGDYERGHRCAGESLTIEVMKVSIDYLVNKIEYEVPEQDLSFSMDDIPSIPKSKLILKNVTRVKESIN